MAVWLSGSALTSIGEVTLHRAWLVLRWMTNPGFSSRVPETYLSIGSITSHPQQLSLAIRL